MGMSTIAEGVEHTAQARLLKEFGCDAFQGYLVAPAMPPAVALSFCAAHQSERRPQLIA
jgi:EAL domain-containing protein (putative c-di-GMP-specific phosphodiesterase class I)